MRKIENTTPYHSNYSRCHWPLVGGQLVTNSKGPMPLVQRVNGIRLNMKKGEGRKFPVGAKRERNDDFLWNLTRVGNIHLMCENFCQSQVWTHNLSLRAKSWRRKAVLPHHTPWVVATDLLKLLICPSLRSSKDDPRTCMFIRAPMQMLHLLPSTARTGRRYL